MLGMLGHARTNKNAVEMRGIARNSGWRGRGIGTAMGIALAVSLFAASGAHAQNCTTNASFNFQNLALSPPGITSGVASAITAANTAFLLQNEAFIGAPPNPAPGQQGGGVWVRGVGGEVDIKSTTAANGTVTGINPFSGTPVTVPGSVNCSQKVDTSFAGVQFGADVAKFNINGWNFHVGTTAGYLGTKGNLVGGAVSFQDSAGAEGGGPYNTTTQVPFIGGYVAATNGGFFVSGLLRAEYYQTTLNAPGANLFNQSLDAHGWSFAGSIGYNWQVPNTNWFIEPSAGISISRAKVDPFNLLTFGSVPAATAFSGSMQINDIKSDIGRLGLRFGTTIESGNVIWQPFAAVSVWHEFGPNVTSTATTCSGCAFVSVSVPPVSVSVPVTVTGTSSTSTFGTYGQYSLGVSGALAGTGWLGFARVDFRDGPNLQGWSGTGGIRYQFTPEPAPKSLAIKSKAPPPAAAEAINWTGFYIGGFGGAVLGTADWGLVGGEVAPHIGGYLFGGDVGYNYQTGPYVLGIEGDLATTNTKGGTACGPLIVGGSMFQMTCNASSHWIATATARAGYAWERVLLYVKGGGAWTNEQFSATCNVGPLNGQNPPGQNCTNPAGASSNGFTASSNRGGWVIGWGTEFAFTRNWSAKAETDYVSFGDGNVTASDGSPLKDGMHIWEGKIGVNYRF
jgi:opacity protein-like surface antigen